MTKDESENDGESMSAALERKGASWAQQRGSGPAWVRDKEMRGVLGTAA